MFPSNIPRGYFPAIDAQIWPHLLAEGAGSADPDGDNAEQDDAQVGRGGGQRAEGDNHDLLDERPARLAQWVAHHINGSLALGLHQMNTFRAQHFRQRSMRLGIVSLTAVCLS